MESVHWWHLVRKTDCGMLLQDTSRVQFSVCWSVFRLFRSLWMTEGRWNTETSKMQLKTYELWPCAGTYTDACHRKAYMSWEIHTLLYGLLLFHGESVCSQRTFLEAVCSGVVILQWDGTLPGNNTVALFRLVGHQHIWKRQIGARYPAMPYFPQKWKCPESWPIMCHRLGEGR